jgi:hypothetical protein
LTPRFNQSTNDALYASFKATGFGGNACVLVRFEVIKNPTVETPKEEVTTKPTRQGKKKRRS